MGIKGLYTYLKPYSHVVCLDNYGPQRIGIDAYAVLYKFREDQVAMTHCLHTLLSRSHTLTVYVDGVPPQEKMAEIAGRREQRTTALLEAEALRDFLQKKERVAELDTAAVRHLERQIRVLETESWRVDRAHLQTFVDLCRSLHIHVQQCASEADFDLIQAAHRQQIDIVISNDMDLFVGGVPRLWILGKAAKDPLFREFIFAEISQECGIGAKAWSDIAILAGYEKTRGLKRCDVHQAVIWVRHYGCLENLLARQKDLMGAATLADFQAARKWLQAPS